MYTIYATFGCVATLGILRHLVTYAKASRMSSWPIPKCHVTSEYDGTSGLVSKRARNMRSYGRRPGILDEGNESRYPFDTNENIDTTSASLR